jgi:hypothetical protein
VNRKIKKRWSGRRESDPRPTAWKAELLGYLVAFVGLLGLFCGCLGLDISFFEHRIEHRFLPLPPAGFLRFLTIFAVRRPVVFL